MCQLEQLAFEIESDKGGDMGIPRSNAVGIEGVNGRAVGECRAEIVVGVGSYGGVGEYVGGCAEVVVDGKVAEGIVDCLTDGWSWMVIIFGGE